MASSASRITGVRPLWASKAAASRCRGKGSAVDPVGEVRIGPADGAACSAASTAGAALSVPAGLDGGQTAGAPCRLARRVGLREYRRAARNRACTRSTARCSIGTATSWSRSAARAGSRCRCRCYVVRPDGSREPFVTGSRTRRRWRSIPRGAPRLEPLRRVRVPGRARRIARSCRQRPRGGVRDRVRCRRRAVRRGPLGHRSCACRTAAQPSIVNPVNP
jgi:hypothetical protein